jgi:hypothetical protein
MDGMTPVTDALLETQLKGLSHPRTRAGAVATLLLMLRRTEPSSAPVLLPHVGRLTQLLDEGVGADAPPDDTVRVRGERRGLWVQPGKRSRVGRFAGARRCSS